MSALAVLLSSLIACASPLPGDLSCPALSVAMGEGIEVSQGRVMTPEEAQIFGMGAMFEDRAPPPRAAAPLPRVRVALLSSGGQRGAFTAGFMAGWSKNRTDPRPARFDVVTGVSTGALLAPFVFGGPEYDAALTEAYNGLSERDVLRRRGTLALARAPSLWDPGPLAARVDRQLAETGLLDEIAREAADRSLLVGAVNLRTGFFEALDVTSAAAKDGQNRAVCVREALLASAAIPVAFPPRRINGDLYVDGAARQGLFLRGLAAARVRPVLYVFLNNAVGFPEDDPRFALPTLAGRTTEILSDQLLRSSAEDAIRFAQSQGWRVRGVFVPEIWPGPECRQPGGQKIAFCPSFTRQLYAAGFDMAREGRIPWLNARQLIDRLTAPVTAQRRN